MIKGNKKTTINLTVLGKRYKYIIPQYFLFELLTYNNMEEKKIAKFIQKNIIDEFKSHKFLVKNGITRTINELVFIYILENGEKDFTNQKLTYKEAYLDIEEKLQKLEEEKKSKIDYAITDLEIDEYF